MAVEKNGPSGPQDDQGGEPVELREALDQGRRRGRRPRDVQVDNLFVPEVSDEDLEHVYVKPGDDYDRALEALRRRHVVVLQGRPGSGRHAMARHLLLHDLGVARIEKLDAGADPVELAPRDERVGHLLERCPPDRASRLQAGQLTTAAALLERRQGFLVITVDDGVPVLGGQDHGWVVTCAHVPDLQLVLQAHLELRLRDRGGLRDEDRSWLEGDAVRTHLAEHGELGLVVRLARDLLRPLAGPPTPERRQRLDSLLAAEPPEQRGRRLLERSRDVEHWSQVIALAAFEGGQPRAVADAAGLLAKRLAPEDLRSDTAWRPGPARAEWLRPAGAGPPGGDRAGLLLQRRAADDAPAWRPGPARTNWLEETGAETFEALEHAVLFNRSLTRRVRFKDPALRAAILDRVWNELDELRGPVRDWLDELGGDHDPEVREQTAATVAYLASHGLGYVLELIIVPWMRRGRWTREMAALALGVLARDDRRFTGPVLAQLSQWARWGDPTERETAAMAYGRAIGQRMPSLALRELHALALRGGNGRPVAEAMVELVRRWRHREVLEALCGWTARPELPTWSPAERRLLHTGLTAFLLATRVYDESGRWPVLLAQAAESPQERKRVVVLWRRALADDVLGEAAGSELCGWAREADVQTSACGGDQPDLVRSLEKLVKRVARGGGPANRGRVRHALTRCAKAYDDPSAVAWQLAESLR